MIKHLALLWDLLTGRLECAVCGGLRGDSHCNGCHNAPKFCVCDVADLVPVDCDGCGYPLGYCCCDYPEATPHDLSDYDEYLDAVSMKCRGCGLKTTFTAGDIYPRPYAGPADPMCMACQALLAEPVTR